MRQAIRREASRIEEWMEKHLEGRLNKAEEIIAMMHAQLRIIVNNLRTLSNQDDNVINGIQKEMEEHVEAKMTVVLERIESIIRSLRENTKEVGTGTKTTNDCPRTRNLCVMTKKLAKISLGNADRLEYLVKELKGQVPSSMQESNDGSPKINPNNGQTSSRHESRTPSTTRSSGSPTPRNLAEDVRRIIRSMNELERAVTSEGLSRFEDLVYDLGVLTEDLENHDVVIEHFMNVDITEDVHIYKLWEQISDHIQDEAKEDCWDDAQRIHLTKICEKTLDALTSAGGSDEQKQALLMKAISEPKVVEVGEQIEEAQRLRELLEPHYMVQALSLSQDSNGVLYVQHAVLRPKITAEEEQEMNEEGERINVNAPWLKDPERCALKDRVAIGKRHGGKNILTTIKEAEAFLSAEKEIKKLNEALTHIREVFGMAPCPDDMIVKEAGALKDRARDADQLEAKVAELTMTIQSIKSPDDILRAIKEVQVKVQREESELFEQDKWGYLSSSGKARLNELSGCVQGVEMVLNAIGPQKMTIKPKTTVELAAQKSKDSVDTINEIREMLSLLVRKTLGLPKTGTDGMTISGADIRDYAQKIGLIE